MAYKTILVHIDHDPKLDHRVRAAGRLAEIWGGEVIGLHIRPSLSDVYAPTPGIADMIRKAREDEADQAAGDLKARFAHLMAETGAAHEWRTAEGHDIDTLTLHARYADLTILGQPPEHHYEGMVRDLPEKVILGCGGPVLIMPWAGGDLPFGRRIVVAWNATRESARAAADALPFLQAAELVSVATVIDGDDTAHHGEEITAAMALRLSRQGVKASAATVLRHGFDPANALLNHAADIGADMMVMGCYGHSRLREHLFGGMTRDLLAQMPTPVLMAH